MEIQSGSRTLKRACSQWRVKAGPQHKSPMLQARVISLTQSFVIISAGRPDAIDILSISIFYTTGLSHYLQDM